MSKTLIVYWSGTGNTEKMAELIAQGASMAGAQVTTKSVTEVSPDIINEYDFVALGSPSMGVEVIEEDNMEPFVEAISGMVAEKNIALFGSYGWGDGEWMRSWEERMRGYHANIIGTAICNDAPQGEDADACVELGKKLA